jgi:hypothetical protein
MRANLKYTPFNSVSAFASYVLREFNAVLESNDVSTRAQDLAINISTMGYAKQKRRS